MNTKLGTIANRSLLAIGLALGIASAQAGNYNVTRDQEQAVQPGMTADAVRAALGAPTAVQSVGNEPGPIWTYRVADVTSSIPDERLVFDIHFGADQRVSAVNELFIEPLKSDGD